MARIDEITERVNRNGDVNDLQTPRPLLTLEEFFDGNDVVGCICCNLLPTPTPAEVFENLKGIRARPDVADVRVQVTMFDSPDWPFSDTVWVMSSAAPDAVKSWFEAAFTPDECAAGWVPGTTYEPMDVPAGMQPIYCWWD
jgi:hypothetical protein